jgi:hypothetical protein
MELLAEHDEQELSGKIVGLGFPDISPLSSLDPLKKHMRSSDAGM